MDATAHPKKKNKMTQDITKAKDETEKCWLEYDDEGYLTCTYDHTAGALCLGCVCRYCKKLECVCYKDDTQDTTKMVDMIETEERFVWEDDFDALFVSEQYTYDDDTRESYLFNDDVDARDVKQWIEDKILQTKKETIERCLNEIQDTTKRESVDALERITERGLHWVRLDRVRDLIQQTREEMYKEAIRQLDGMACASSPQVEHGYRLAVKDAKERLQSLNNTK